MNKKLLELLDAINDKKTVIRDLVTNNKLEEAKVAKAELQEMQDKFDIMKDIEIEEKAQVIEKKPVQKRTAVEEFANAARRGFRNSMNEGTKTDGGYTVPEDILTMINEHKEASVSLTDIVDVESVSTNTGRRTFKKKSGHNGFTKVGEGGKIPAAKTPEFEAIAYTISKYAGFFPVTNELLEDSDANITAVLTKWIADESVATRNGLILAAVATQDATDLKDLDGIKKALNVTLGQAYKPTAKIVTNDDGLQYLDTLKDGMGRYMLQPNPQDPMQLVLCAGATTVPVIVVPNSQMATDGEKVPFIIGDLIEGIKFFDRKLTTITTSNVASAGDFNAFEEDMTLFKAIEREDVQVKDADAFVNGYITVVAG